VASTRKIVVGLRQRRARHGFSPSLGGAREAVQCIVSAEVKMTRQSEIDPPEIGDHGFSLKAVTVAWRGFCVSCLLPARTKAPLAVVA